MAEQATITRNTGLERMARNNPRNMLTEVLKNAYIYDIAEISRQEDIPKLHETLRLLPDNPEVSYIIPILEIRD